MIKVITDKRKIEKFQKKFHVNLFKDLNETISCKVGYAAGSFPDKVKYSSKYNIWVSTHSEHNRYWNGFGIGKPVESKHHSLVGEVNFPLQGINRSVAGVFAEDDNGNILILHRGKIGGGKIGIGKNLFIEKFKDEPIFALDGDRQSMFFLVGELDSELFGLQVSNFIHEIYNIKNHNDINEFEHLKDFVYSDEKFGVSVTENSEPRIIHRTHGLIVNALSKVLIRKGYTIANDKNRDLFTHKNKKITNLFEIKTNISTQCIYSAVGQLIIYSMPCNKDINLFAVLPNKLKYDVAKRLKDHGINLLYYTFNEDEIIFKNLDEILLP